MDVHKLNELIDSAMLEIKNFVKTSIHYTDNDESILSTRKVLNLLKEDLNNENQNLNENILRAMHDVGMSSYKEFENTQLETAINKITGFLYKEIPKYKFLKPLRGEFGKGNPI